MTLTKELKMVDGVRIIVPDSLNLITSYVLQEQQDWFEDEIKFVRHLLQSGDQVIDIGANYGVYTLSMAKKVGSKGGVWAFEPASSTAKFLADGIAANNFTWVVLEQSALSNKCGTAQISLNLNSELNALVHGLAPIGASEAVILVTLDECMGRYDWSDIAFMKIDAEGEEENIIKGGKEFFSNQSPLIQYEIKAGKDYHMELVKYFAAIGYESYRLVPGLNLLVPFDAESPPDGYLLNLFCCKQDTANLLISRGFLLDSTAFSTTTCMEKLLNNNCKYGWRHSIAKLPYGKEFSNLWEQGEINGHNSEIIVALSFYAISHDFLLSSTERFSALEASFRALKALCEEKPSHLRLSSLARVASDYGARSISVVALQQLHKNITQTKNIDISEPFLTAGNRFDRIPPGNSIGVWVMAFILEEVERLSSFSSFYTGMSALERLETIKKLGFGSEEMERRLSLLRERFQLTT